MTIRHYAISVIPADFYDHANRLVAMIEGEDILNSRNIGQPANEDGSYTDIENPAVDATHWYGGRYVDAAWLNTYQHLTSNLPAPAGDWPLVVNGSVALTKAQAIAAASAIRITVTTGEDSSQMPQETLAAALGAIGVKPILY